MKQQVHHVFPPSRTGGVLRLGGDGIIAQAISQDKAGEARPTPPRATFPILAVLAPVMTQAEGEITYPGDPMCLYAALSVALDRAVQANQGLATVTGYEELAPRWTSYPSKRYRLHAPFDGYRNVTDPVIEDNTDRTVFDPRIWDDQARWVFVARLRAECPRIVLISSVSPGHRYALEMSRIVKAELPDCLVVLGGRHIDETVRFDERGGTLELHSSSPISVMADKRVAQTVDVVISGQAYYALDLVLRAAARAMDPQRMTVSPLGLVSALRALGPSATDLEGKAAIVVLDADTAHVFPMDARPIRFEALPSFYRGFAIRSRFSIFPDAAYGSKRTAHAMLSTSCPYSCSFCSESAKLTGGMLRVAGEAPVTAALHRVRELVQSGAEALFFDDSIFWGGNLRLAQAFCEELCRARAEVGVTGGPWDEEAHGDSRRLQALEWGAQLTADIIATQLNPEDMSALLRAMQRAGCTYVYLGLESMSAAVMGKIHKNLQQRSGLSWKDKVRIACRQVKAAGMRVGTSVLFGLEGETPATIDETIEEVGRLIDDGLIDLASPNILTYHPATPITALHGMSALLDYHTAQISNRPPYTYFEEAYPGVVSRSLREDDLWRIHTASARRWGAIRNNERAEVLTA